MWFTNAQIYQYDLGEIDLTTELLENEKLKPCPAHARFIYGWMPPFKDELIAETSGCQVICLGKEERILPKSVVQKFLIERVNHLETEQGRHLKRTEKAQLAEDIEFELLPKSFCVQKSLMAFFDTVRKRLIINTASETGANQLLALLRKSIPGAKFEPLFTQENLAHHFASWLIDITTLPTMLQLASDCVLYAPNNEKKRISCKGYELPAEEIVTLLSQGLIADELSLIWNERIQFTLTSDFTLKRLKCLDYLQDDFHETNQLDSELLQRDAALTLLSSELRALIDNLLSLFNQVTTRPSRESQALATEAPALL